MDLGFLKSEFARLGEKYHWLNHAIVLFKSVHDWPQAIELIGDQEINAFAKGVDRRQINAVRQGLGVCEELSDRRILAMAGDFYLKRTHGISVFYAEQSHSAEETKDALRQLNHLAQAAMKAVPIMNLWGRQYWLVEGGYELSFQAFRGWIDHLHAVYQPRMAFTTCKVSASEEAAVEVYQLPCGVFEASLACLNQALTINAITLEQIAELLQVDPKTVQNKKSKLKETDPMPKALSEGGNEWDYGLVQSWLVRHWPRMEHRLPASFEKAREILI